MTIKQEFEKAFDKDHIGDSDLRFISITDYYNWVKADKFESALWAAKWMADRQELLKEIERLTAQVVFHMHDKNKLLANNQELLSGIKMGVEALKPFADSDWDYFDDEIVRMVRDYGSKAKEALTTLNKLVARFQ